MNIRRLFERHYPSLVWYLHGRLGDRDLAEDLAQEAFVRLLDKPPRAPDAAQIKADPSSTAFMRPVGCTATLPR